MINQPSVFCHSCLQLLICSIVDCVWHLCLHSDEPWQCQFWIWGIKSIQGYIGKSTVDNFYSYALALSGIIYSGVFLLKLEKGGLHFKHCIGHSCTIPLKIYMHTFCSRTTAICKFHLESADLQFKD